MPDIITNINDGAEGLAKLKEELTAAIQEKGGSADSGQPLTAYPDYVRSIPPEGDFVTKTELEAMGLVTQKDLEKLPTGVAIGTIFAHPSEESPAGAYPLNGSTIACTDELLQQFYEWVTTANIRRITALEYEYELDKHDGVCNGFVVDGQSVRLPTWKGYQTPLGDSVPVKGTGMALGLTDGENNDGMCCAAGLGLSFNLDSYGADSGKPIASGATMAANVSIGVTEDPEKSGIIADTSAYPQEGFHWYIQVYNAATELSELTAEKLANEIKYKAHDDFSNIDAEKVSQSFKTMSIGWGMPDYTAGIDITGDLQTRGSGYEVKYDCVLKVLGLQNRIAILYSKSGIYLAGNEASYPDMVAYLQTPGTGAATTYVTLHKGQKLYTPMDYDNGGKFILYPLKGANKND